MPGFSGPPADPLQAAIRQFARLPGIGEKTASRLVFFLLQADPQQTRDLAAALTLLIDKIHLCSVCLQPTAADPCRICQDAKRDRSAICVVERPQDLLALENCGEYRGLYHVLHGRLAPLSGVGPDELHVAELLRRLSGEVREIILATSSTNEGEATAVYLSKLLKPLAVKVTRIASGLPIGGDLEYADRLTLARALAGRGEW